MNSLSKLWQFQNSNGFIAALDQSGGSTPSVLKSYGTPKEAYASESLMFKEIHAMRVRIMKSPSFNGERVIGTILFNQTIDEFIDDQPVPEYLWDKLGVLPFMKIDDGLDQDIGGVCLMKPIQDIDAKLKAAVSKGIFGTKMRSVINKATPGGINEIVTQQIEIAEKIIEYGLVPIVEPEVSIGNVDKEECEALLCRELIDAIDHLTGDKRIALKLTLPTIDNYYSDLIAHSRVVRTTALSGGYDQALACEKLVSNKGMIASFSRAFAEGLLKSQSDTEFNKRLTTTIENVYSASCT